MGLTLNVWVLFLLCILQELLAEMLSLGFLKVINGNVKKKILYCLFNHLTFPGLKYQSAHTHRPTLTLPTFLPGQFICISIRMVYWLLEIQGNYFICWKCFLLSRATWAWSEVTFLSLVFLSAYLAKAGLSKVWVPEHLYSIFIWYLTQRNSSLMKSSNSELG